MTFSITKWLLCASLILGITNSIGFAQEQDPGEQAFKSACASCHGIDGKGKGPFSIRLKVAPADLTTLSKKNGGVFPVKAVYEIIDGRKMIAAHGTREMPIWGYVFTPTTGKPTESLEFKGTGLFLDFTYNPESVVQARILAIIDYLNRIQQR